MVSKEHIRKESSRLGFSFCGFARAEPLEQRRSFYQSFLREKRHGEIGYLETQLEKRLDPRLLMPEAKSVIALLMNYFPGEIIPAENNYIIAKYAYGSDYHPFMKEKLRALSSFIMGTGNGVLAMPFSDSGVVKEKLWAQQCGLGWQGKNTILINKNQGSFFFIGIILTNLEIGPDKPDKDHCGTCDHCVKACPTGALDTPYQLEITRCLSYHTIETSGEFPDEFRLNQYDRIYGCDICQDACPFNRRAVPSPETDFRPSEALKSLRKPAWHRLTEEDFSRIFEKSAVKRTGYKKLMDNLPKE
ncbi:MAG: tRNA epoxyqueuosine(34) reductase QueG [bacterium]